MSDSETDGLPEPEPPAPDAPPVVTAPVCAVHESAPATGTCERCGNYTCPLCLDAESRLAYCEACRDRTGMGQIAWERADGGWLSRWWETSRGVILRPTETFGAVWAGSLPRALSYVAVTGALMGGLLMLVMGCLLGVVFAIGFAPPDMPEGSASDPVFMAIMAGVVLLFPVFQIAWLFFSVGLRGLLYQGAARVLGGDGRLADSMWVMAYLHAVQLVTLPLAILQQIPILGLLISLLGYLGIEVFIAQQLTDAAKRYHHLEGGRAALAGWFGFFFALLLGTSCCVLGMVAVFAAR